MIRFVNRRRLRLHRSWILLTACLAAVVGPSPAAPDAPAVTVHRLPHGAVQPQAVVDAEGVIHLIYLTGDPMAADVRYDRTSPGKFTFGEPVRVNTHPGSAIAVGTVRGPHVSLGKGGRVHVAWMGSGQAQPKAPGKQAPMLYARLADDGRSFEPERNVIAKFVGLDGGGSVAADADGNLYVAWHAPAKKGGDEGTRRVFVARSADDGATFAPEVPITNEERGACGCCGMRLLAARGGPLFGLFRTAYRQVHRDTRLITFGREADEGAGVTLDPVNVATCQMSTYAMAGVPGQQRFVAAWESRDQVRFGASSYRAAGAEMTVHDLPDAKGRGPDAPGRKHPSVAVDAAGNVLVAWAEGTGWERGGAVAWQLFDPHLRAMPGAAGRGEGLPAWSLPAAVALKGGGFAVIY